MDKIFLVSFDLQRDEISTLCFDTCKSILIGAMELELDPGLPSMVFLPCPREECPYLERQIEEPTVVHDNQSFHLRKLKPLSEFIDSSKSSDALIAGLKACSME